jgi:ABC-type nitrate/sulfonate/bicarbonate transport system, ATPase component
MTISINNVTKAYMNRKKNEAKIVLDDVSISIEDSEFLCIIGPSGCGKTTLLNLIAGFEKTTIGEIICDGEEVKGASPERGVVFQEYSLLPWMNVLQNVMLALECKAVPVKERNEIAMNALKTVGLTEFADQRPNLLSGGMKQRTAIARMIAMDPKIMLMDEPFSSLDEQTRKRLDKDFVDIWSKNGKTVVFVTHNVEEALITATRIILLSSSPGKVVKEWRLPYGTDRDVMSEEMIALKREILDALQECSCTEGSGAKNIIEIKTED